MSPHSLIRPQAHSLLGVCWRCRQGERPCFPPAESLTVFLVFAASTILSPFYVFFFGGRSLEEAAEEVGKEFRTYKLMDPLESGPAWSYKDPRQTWGWRWGRGGQDLWT